MKKLLAILLALMMLVSGISAFAEETATPGELGENQILMHGYLSPYCHYYIGVPAEWALIGAGSTPENINQAYEIVDDDVSGIISQMSAENDILFAVSAAGENLVLTYGPAEGANNDHLIKEIEVFKNTLISNYPGIKLSDDCGSYTFNGVVDIMYIGANYNGHAIRQYYLASGSTLFIFTFSGVSKDMAETVLSTFNIQ